MDALKNIAISAAIVVLSACGTGSRESGNVSNSAPSAVIHAGSAPQDPPSVSVDLSSAGNVYALVNDGTAVAGGGIDGGGDGYSESLTGRSITWSGATFALGASGTKNGVSGVKVSLPPGNYSSVQLLATAVNGNQPNQPFIVTYTDGTTKTFTQSLSDWYSPQNYPGEAQAMTLSHRVIAGGATQNGPFYLYGYALAVDSSRTIQSLTLPSNRNVVIVAIDLSASAPSAATPTMSPSPGTYGAAQTVSLADTTAGAGIYYTTNGTTPTTSSTKYTGPIQVTTTTTIQAIAVAPGYSDSPVASGTYTIVGSQPAVSVNLSSVANVHALVNDGMRVSGGGLDGYGNAYSETLTGTSVTWAGVTFTLGGAGAPNGNGVKGGATVLAPAGNYSSVRLLATAVNGYRPKQTFVVTYADGTSTTITQSLSDWYGNNFAGQGTYQGESRALAMPYRVTGSSGSTQAGPFYLYGYSLAIDGGRTLKSLTLPNSSNVVVLAMSLIPVSPASYPTYAAACNPMTYGAVGDGTTDNTTAIQNAINACAAQGGGVVELGADGGTPAASTACPAGPQDAPTAACYVTGPIALESNVQLQIDSGAILKSVTVDPSNQRRYVPAFINWIYRPNEALISAQGADNVGIVGNGTIDGSGSPWWAFVQNNPEELYPLLSTNPQPPYTFSRRPYLIEFYRCDTVTISGLKLANSPYWTQALRFSNDITEYGVVVSANPPGGANTDGVDIVGSTDVTLSDLNIGVGDDDIAIKSGLPILANDPNQAGLPQMATSGVQVTNIFAGCNNAGITEGCGSGLAIGSEAVNGVSDVTIQHVQLNWTTYGFRIKSGNDRGGPIDGITVADLALNSQPHTTQPLILSDYYSGTFSDQGVFGSAGNQPTPTQFEPYVHLPYIHDITVRNFSATGESLQSGIAGLPESCVRNVTLTNVTMALDRPMVLHHMTGTFTNVIPGPAGFAAMENVSVAGTTQFHMPALAGQTACGQQPLPGS